MTGLCAQLELEAFLNQGKRKKKRRHLSGLYTCGARRVGKWRAYPGRPKNSSCAGALANFLAEEPVEVALPWYAQLLGPRWPSILAGAAAVVALAVGYAALAN